MERTCRNLQKKNKIQNKRKIKAKLSTGAQINAKQGQKKVKCINDGCGALGITRKEA